MKALVLFLLTCSINSTTLQDYSLNPHFEDSVNDYLHHNQDLYVPTLREIADHQMLAVGPP